MRLVAVGLGVLLSACDPYEAAKQEKLAHLPGCNVPFGTPDQAHVAGLALCGAHQSAPAGFVIVTGQGTRSAYGDLNDPFMPNALSEPGSCAGAGGDFTASRAFWAQVGRGLREKLIIQNGQGVSEVCDGERRQPDLLGFRIIDWADLDKTVEFVKGAMSAHDICSPVVVEVGGVTCGQFL